MAERAHPRHRLASLVGSLLVVAGLIPIAAPVPVFAATEVFINEIHYDNASTDVGEAIEVAGPAGTDLSGWSLVFYNGSGGASYGTAALGGVLADAGSGFGAASFAFAGIQNGAPDGVALVNGTTVIQFLSYEGAFTATGGPANGMLSVDIGVLEAGTETVGTSLGLIGTGTSYEDFTWTAGLVGSFGSVNPGQAFGTIVTPTDPSGVGAATPSTVAAGDPTLLTVTVTPGANPTSTGVAVAADLTAIGGSATQGFFDDATNGDATAGDNVFSFAATVDAGTADGLVSLPALITDAEARSATAAIELTVSAPPPPPPPAGSVVVGEVYGGGGNANATLTNDFIELFNRTAAPISVAGWSVQYGASGGTTWQVTPLTGSIPANGTYLVQEAAGNAGTLGLPTPDAIGTIAMSGTNGKVALVATTTPLSGACPVSPTILDRVGYGTANCSETSPTPALSNTTSAQRNGGGSIDTDNNLADFTIGNPSPRGATEPGPQILASFPTKGGVDAAPQGDLSLVFSEAVDVAGTWFTIGCATSGAHTATVSGGPTVFYLDPDTDFAPNESCTLTILAGQVTDQDTDDPSDAMSADALITFTTGSAESCGDAATSIHTVQGSGLASPLANSTVSLEAVVVGDYQDSPSQFGGFHLQEQDADADADPATSEGVFVFHGLAGLRVAPGDVVRVRGTVFEFGSSGTSLTEISPVRRILVCSGGASVTPASVSLPVAGADDLEAFEGMSVSIAQDLTVTEVFNLGRFGEVSLSATGRLPTPTNVVAPGAPALALQDLNDRSRILLDDASNLQNIDPTVFPQGGLSASNTLRVGDSVASLAGVLEQRFGVFRVQPTGPISFNHTNPRPDAPEPVGGNLQVASFNVLNYFNGDGLGGGFPTARGAETPFELDRQRAKEVAAITELDADIVGLMELENDDPATEYAAIEDLVDGLNAATAPGTYGFIDTGIVGTDEIRVALLYKPGVVTPVGDHAVIDSTVDPTFVDTLNRPSIAQTFELNSTGARVTVVVNHLKSKGSDCNAVDDPDEGDGQGNCNLTRTAAATALANWLATDPTGAGDADYLIIGDLNSYAMEDPITALRNAGFVDTIHAFVGAGAYSYVFEGQSGYLDHALASGHLAAQVSGVSEWHINPDEPTVLDYNTNFKTPNQVNTFYAPDAYRSSDHDPVLVGLDLNAPPTVDAGGPYAVIEGRSITVRATGSDPDGDALSYAWDLDDNGTFETTGRSARFSAAGLEAPLSLTIRVQVSDGDLTATDAATVKVIWGFHGFIWPIRNPPLVNTEKAGSAVPIWFLLEGRQGRDVLAAGYPRSAAYTCGTPPPLDATEPTNTTAAGFTSIPFLGLYAYNWKTEKSWAGTCRVFVLKLADGTDHYALFKFKK